MTNTTALFGASFGKVGMLLVIVVHWLGLQAQGQYQPQAITVKDGLGFRFVTATVQDSDGFIWIGTDKGLNRYDGSRFLYFNKERTADFPFPADQILENGLLVRNDTTLWIVGDHQLYSLNLETYQYRLVETGITGDIWYLQRGRADEVWLAVEDVTEHQLWRYTPADGFCMVNAVPRPRREFTHLQVDTFGNAWWSTINEGLRCISPQGEVLHHTVPDSNLWFSTTMHFTPFLIDGQNRMYICPKSRHQIWEYFPELDSMSVVVDSLPSVAYSTFSDNYGNNWFGTTTSVVQIKENGEVKQLADALGNILDFSRINNLYQDQSDVIWMATNGGLLYLPQPRSLFTNLLTAKEGQPNNELRGICEGPDDQLYVYCEYGDRGLHQVDRYTGESQRLSFQVDSIEELELFDQAKQLFYDECYQAIWAFTTQLQRINLAPSPTITTIRNPPGIDYPPRAESITSPLRRATPSGDDGRGDVLF